MWVSHNQGLHNTPPFYTITSFTSPFLHFFIYKCIYSTYYVLLIYLFKYSKQYNFVLPVPQDEFQCSEISLKFKESKSVYKIISLKISSHSTFWCDNDIESIKARACGLQNTGVKSVQQAMKQFFLTYQTLNPFNRTFQFHTEYMLLIPRNVLK